jgi:hypothetical protein
VTNPTRLAASGTDSIGTLRKAALAAALLGLGGLAAGVALSPTQAFGALLTSAFYFLSLGAGGAVFLALMYVANAGWHTALKRVPEAFASYLPFGAGTMLLLLPGLPALYMWARPGVMEHDHLLHTKHAFLNTPFFAVRMVVLLVLWTAFAVMLRRNSVQQDKVGGTEGTKKNVVVSAVFLCVFALTYCLAAFDWIMSLEPHWFSTIFGFYNIAGMLASTVAALIVACILLRRAGLLPEFNESHQHDLAKLMFGFATFWAYQWISQFLLIWYSNIPEETVYFVRRLHGGWGPVFYLNLVLNWALPFALLLPRPAKRSEKHVLRVAILMLAARWLDLHLMVAPANSETFTGIGVWDVAAFVGVAGLFVLAVTRAVKSAPLLARHDPYLGESLHHHI